MVLGYITKQDSNDITLEHGFVGSAAERDSRQAPARAIPTNSARLTAAFPSGLISTGMNKQMKQMGPTLYCMKFARTGFHEQGGEMVVCQQ